MLIHFTILDLEGNGMKMYAHGNGIILVGKGWEVLQKLKELNKEYLTVSEWVENTTRK
jgi:hypothetical protein